MVKLRSSRKKIRKGVELTISTSDNPVLYDILTDAFRQGREGHANLVVEGRMFNLEINPDYEHSEWVTGDWIHKELKVKLVESVKPKSRLKS